MGLQLLRGTQATTIGPVIAHVRAHVQDQTRMVVQPGREDLDVEPPLHLASGTSRQWVKSDCQHSFGMLGLEADVGRPRPLLGLRDDETGLGVRTRLIVASETVSPW